MLSCFCLTVRKEVIPKNIMTGCSDPKFSQMSPVLTEAADNFLIKCYIK